MSHVLVTVLLAQLPLTVSTEEVSSPPASGKGDKRGADTAARKKRSKGGEDIPKTKRVKHSKGAHETTKGGKMRECYHEEDSASSDQSFASSDEGQSSTSSEEGEDQCREWEGTYCR